MTAFTLSFQKDDALFLEDSPPEFNLVFMG